MKRPKRQSANHLLGSLPERTQKQLLSKMDRVELVPRKVLYDPNQAIAHVYFPEEGVISLVSTMKEGAALEIATVGKEGMVGVPVLLGADSSPLQAFAQVPGHALKMSAPDFRHELANGTGLRRLLERYTQALFTQLSQSVACNRFHSIEQRCARWLLMTADRVKDGRFKLTQEFLAQMLGVRRPGVNEILQRFQQRGMVAYKQGQIEITNRRKLERVSCECYFIVRQEYERLTGSS
ncbi:MAG TPA: Crp/Fnr family transcriptional regulator [Terriglobales bacterium]|nr:Crp/Fnr family transcriptional regulator [Terriglobales bacterium]